MSTANNTADKKAERSSMEMGLAYGFITVVLVVLYMTKNMDQLLAGTAFNNAGDMATFLAIAFIGALAVAFGGSLPVVASAGTIGSFIVLTAYQGPLIRYLALGAVLFAIGMYGMVVSRNAIRVLMSIELMLNAVMINLVAFARYVDPAEVKGQVFAIFILTVAAAEAAVGLAIVLSIYRNTATVDMDRFNLLKW